MPTVGNLGCLRACTRYGMAVTGAPIASDNFDAGVEGQPRLNSGGMPVWQEVDDPTTFEIADDGAIALATLPREVVDADDDGSRGWLNRSPPSDQSEQRVATDWQG